MISPATALTAVPNAKFGEVDAVENVSTVEDDEGDGALGRFLGTFQTRREKQLREQYQKDMVLALQNPQSDKTPSPSAKPNAIK